MDATQPLLSILIDECGWEPRQLVSKPRQWRVPASPSDKRRWPVDIAIFDSPAHCRDEEHVRIICECKRPDETSGILQLKMYLDREPHAKLGIWFNGSDHVIVYKTRNIGRYLRNIEHGRDSELQSSGSSFTFGMCS